MSDVYDTSDMSDVYDTSDVEADAEVAGINASASTAGPCKGSERFLDSTLLEGTDPRELEAGPGAAPANTGPCPPLRCPTALQKRLQKISSWSL
jgi:hypothetical protein